jgi:hypothetical protein
MKKGNSPDDFDLFIMRQSTALLNNLGEASYGNKLAILGVQMPY